MLASNTTILFGRQVRRTSLSLWLLQRASAVLLGPLVAIHVLVPGAAYSAWVGALLLVMVLGHAVSAVWRLAAMRQVGVGDAGFRTLVLITLVVAAVLAVLGVATLFAL